MRTNTGQILYIPKIGQRANLQHPLMKGCVGWWPLTDGAGGIAKDIVGTNDGTLVDLSWNNTEVGTNVEFPSIDGDQITTTLNVTGYTDITVSGWLRNDGSSAGSSYGKFVSTSHLTSLDFYMNKPSNIVWFRVGGNLVQFSGTMPAKGTWFHAVGTWSASGRERRGTATRGTWKRRDSTSTPAR